MSSFLPSARGALRQTARMGARGSARSVQTQQLRTYAAASSKASASSGARSTSASQSKPASSSSSSSSKLGTTSAADLHPLPTSVKDAAKPSSSGDTPKYDAQGNSVSAADMSSRPAAPGPSAPQTSASTAAPGLAEGSQQQPSTSSSSSSSSSSQLDSNWASSFAGMSSTPFPREVAEVLEQPINENDIEIKPDGLLYLPEIKYRRILNRAFGPGGWGLAPRGETNVSDKVVSREWALVCLGRFVSTARGEQEYFDPNGVATASEGAKSNALMRCCKDLGIAHELWSPRFIRDFKQRSCVEVFVENASTGRKRKLWRRKDGPPFEYPWKESK